jgi:hypothetical protein
MHAVRRLRWSHNLWVWETSSNASVYASASLAIRSVVQALLSLCTPEYTVTRNLDRYAVDSTESPVLGGSEHERLDRIPITPPHHGVQVLGQGGPELCVWVVSPLRPASCVEGVMRLRAVETADGVDRADRLALSLPFGEIGGILNVSV